MEISTAEYILTVVSTITVVSIVLIIIGARRDLGGLTTVGCFILALNCVFGWWAAAGDFPVKKVRLDIEPKFKTTEIGRYIIIDNGEELLHFKKSKKKDDKEYDIAFYEYYNSYGSIFDTVLQVNNKSAIHSWEKR